MKNFSVILLAAGRGRRAGGPKAWRRHDCRTLIERQVSFLKRLFPADRISVTIQKAWRERCRNVDPAVAWVPVDPDAPILLSLQTALKKSNPVGWTFLYHVDMPVWNETLFKTLAAYAGDGADAVVPVFEGRGGHPVLLSPEAAREVGGLDAESDRLDVWLRGRHRASLVLPRGTAGSSAGTRTAPRVRRRVTPFREVLENRNA